ncbi:MAG: 39S ribosomal protein L45 [Holosporales bacterium]|jgi:predicted lipid-binding transport protein (Tim44 family)|nr:39S ribosomal protein L45 [Holosporales bacterium]
MFLYILIILTLLIFYKLFREFGKTKNIVINVNAEEMGKLVKTFQSIAPEKIKKAIETPKFQNKLNSDISKLKEKIPTFAPAAFLKKAEEMFDAIFDAFANSNHKILKSMLTESLYKSFSAQIQKREIGNLRQEISIKHKKTVIDKIQLLTNKAKLTILFDVSQMNVMLNSEGISFDNPQKLYRNVLHNWVFEKKFNSKEDWILSKTSSIERQ